MRIGGMDSMQAYILQYVGTTIYFIVLVWLIVIMISEFIKDYKERK